MKRWHESTVIFCVFVVVSVCILLCACVFEHACLACVYVFVLVYVAYEDTKLYNAVGMM